MVCVLSGGNIDTSVLGRIIGRALVQEGRLNVFNVVISDRPGALAQLLKHIASVGARLEIISICFRQDISIKQLSHTKKRKHKRKY